MLAGNGIVHGDELGHGVTGACGDIDGDGYNDLVTSANRLGSSSEGAIFVLFMHGNDTVKSYTRLSQEPGGQLDAVALGIPAMALLGYDLDVLPPRSGSDSSVVFELMQSSPNYRGVMIIPIARNGSVAGTVTVIADGVGGLPAGGPAISSSGFGYSVAPLGDVSGDGNDDILVGALSVPNPAPGGAPGAFFMLYLGADRQVLSYDILNNTSPVLSANVETDSSQFGLSGKTLDDVNGDGRKEIIFGLSRSDHAATDTGEVVIATLGGPVPSPSPSPAPAAAGTVLSAVKIADGSGGFPSGLLDAGDTMGNTSPLGDLDGDGVPDVVVHAPIDDDGATSSGAAYVLFLYRNGTVKHVQKVSALEGGAEIAPFASSFFGSCSRFVQPAGIDGRLVRMACGQYGADDVPNGSGRFYVLRMRSNGTVHHTQPIYNAVGGLPSGTLSGGDFFGASNAGDLGDVDGDGLNDLAVSAPGWDGSVAHGGAVFIMFMHGDDTVRDLSVVSIASLGGLASLGLAIEPSIGWRIAALSPQLPGNPVDLAVSSRYSSFLLFRLASNGTVIPGSAKVIGDGVGGIPNGTVQAGSGFGAVSAVGDLDGDGIVDLSVAAQNEDGTVTDSGAVYLLFMNPGRFAHPIKSFIKITHESAGLSAVSQAGARLGITQAIGDVDGDGVVDLAFAARRDDTGNTSDSNSDRGAVYIAFMGGAVPSPTPTPSPSATPSPTPVAYLSVMGVTAIRNNEGGLPSGLLNMDHRFGREVVNVGDLDSNGVDDLAISATTTGGINRGRIFICFMDSSGSVMSYSVIAKDTATRTDPSSGFDTGFASILGAGMGSLPSGQPLGDDPSMPRLFVGERAFNSNEGALHVLRLNASGLVHSHLRISSGVNGLPSGSLRSNGQFGFALGGLDDMDGDGLLDVVATTLAGTPTAYILHLAADDTVLSVTTISSTAGGGLERWTTMGTTLGNFWKPVSMPALDFCSLPDLLLGSPNTVVNGSQVGGVLLVRFDQHSNGSLYVRNSTLYSNSNGGLGPSAFGANTHVGSSLAVLGDV